MINAKNKSVRSIIGDAKLTVNGQDKPMLVIQTTKDELAW